MATPTGYRVENLGHVVKALERAGVEVADLKDAMARIAEEAKPTYQAVTPRLSGALAADYRTGKAKSKAVLYVGRARVPYAAAQNYGWGPRAKSYKHGRRVSGVKGTFPGYDFVAKGDQAAQPKAHASLERELENMLSSLGLL